MFSFSSYLLGLFLPVLEQTTLFFFHKNLSIISSTISLWESKEFFLFILISLFVFIFPLLKYILLFVISSKHSKKFGVKKLLHWISRYSFVDLFVISIIIILFKKSWFINYNLELGFYFFFFSVISSFIISLNIYKIKNQ